MDRSLALVLIGLVFGGGIGFVVAAGAGVTLNGHDHAAHGSAATVAGHASGRAHDHEMPHDLPEGPQAPAVVVTLTPDPASGWNLHATTTNFRFAPEKAGQPHVSGEGHAHVYVDGKKIARLYGPWLHIPALPDGATVTVTLNANDHRPLAVGGAPVAHEIDAPAE